MKTFQPFIWVKFPVVSSENAKVGSDVSAVIWTTTPWTFRTIERLAFHPDFEYVVVETEKGKLLLAADRVAALQAECGIKEARILAKFKGHHFEYAKIPASVSADSSPGRFSLITSLWIKAPASFTCSGPRRRRLQHRPEIQSRKLPRPWTTGAFTRRLARIQRQRRFHTANPIVVKLLEQRGALLGHQHYKHSYPTAGAATIRHLPRTEQWFIKMDQAANGALKTFRAEALEEIHKVNGFLPGAKTHVRMIEHRPIGASRASASGARLSSFFIARAAASALKISKRFATSSNGSKKKARTLVQALCEELLPPGRNALVASQNGARKYILDVWFDSALPICRSPTVMNGLADVYLEGPDQYRGWFHSSLLVAIGVKNRAPYKGVGHAWLDAR